MASTYTYDVSTLSTVLLNEVRFIIRDIGDDSGITSSNARNPDEAITYALAKANNNVYLAGVLVLESELVDLTLNGDIIKLGPFGDNSAVVAQNMRLLIEDLRKRSGGGMYVDSPDVVFSMTTDSGATLGTTANW